MQRLAQAAVYRCSHVRSSRAGLTYGRLQLRHLATLPPGKVAGPGARPAACPPAHSNWEGLPTLSVLQRNVTVR